MFYGITDLTTFVLGTIFIVLLPGPNSLFVMTVASKAGIRPGYQAAAGVFIGDIILMVLSATGAASVLAASPTLFIVLKYLGAGYLTWIGLSLIRTSIQQWSNRSAAKVQQPSARRITSITPFRTALGISLINPKSILFFVSFFIQFVDPAYEHPVISFFILGVVLQIISVIYLSALILGGAHLARKVSQHTYLSSLLTGGVGLIFIAFGVRLATASLS